MIIPWDVHEAAWRVVEKQEKRNAKDPLMHPERARHNLMTAIAKAVLSERKRCADVARGYKRDASFDDSAVGAVEHNANQANIADAIMGLQP